MTLRQDMIEVLAKAPRLLHESADSVREFVLGQQNVDGGFRGRGSESDLYYTVFALELLMALKGPIPADRLHDYLKSFGHGRSLDLVHLASLVRCWADLSEVTGFPIESQLREGLARRLQDLQCSDGGFSTNDSDDKGNAYGCFMAFSICQDLNIDLLKPGTILRSLAFPGDGEAAVAGDTFEMVATTPTTAAALCAYHTLGLPFPETQVAWLLERIHSQGGFCAVAGEGFLPDLLSTATALHALSYHHPPVPQPRERHLDFLDSLWNPEGGFAGSWADPTLDCEYTFYGLLALGHLAEMS